MAALVKRLIEYGSSLSMGMKKLLLQPVVHWLGTEKSIRDMPMHDFGRLQEHLLPADVVLIEGLSRMSGVIQAVTLSSWTHAALYLGRLDELEDRGLADRLAAVHGWAAEQQLIIEAEVGCGCIISPLERYAEHHLRICRPRNLSGDDREIVLENAISRLGAAYDLRQIVDLLRFFFPYGLLPRRWRSSLFEVGHGRATRLVCSTLVAESFRAVSYPILPYIQRGPDGGYVFRHRNSRLFTPRDFDYSPYFDIIKYPFFGDDDRRLYLQMDWDEDAQFQSVVEATAVQQGRKVGSVPDP